MPLLSSIGKTDGEEAFGPWRSPMSWPRMFTVLISHRQGRLDMATRALPADVRLIIEFPLGLLREADRLRFELMSSS
jgi:hypothetical protein